MTDQALTTEPAKANNSNGKKILLTIVGIPVVVLLFSTALYYLANNKVIDLGTVNNGTLVVPPLQFSKLDLSHSNGKPFDYSQPERKWSFVVIGGAECNEACERMLYISRQSHHALERRMPRIRRYYVNYESVSSEALQNYLADEYKTTELLYANKQQLNEMINNSALHNLEENRFYVVDHNGWLMMYYEAEDFQQNTLNDLGKKVIKDMKRLLK